LGGGGLDNQSHNLEDCQAQLNQYHSSPPLSITALAIFLPWQASLECAAWVLIQVGTVCTYEVGLPTFHQRCILVWITPS